MSTTTFGSCVLLAVLATSAFYLQPTSAANGIQPIPWWAKPISRDIATAGCLTQAQIEDVRRAGYKSLLSMFNSDSAEAMGGEEYLSTDTERAFAKKLGLEYGVVLKPDEYDWMCMDTLRTFSRLFNEMPKPILFHCMSAYSASFITLLYYVNQTTCKPDCDERALTVDAEGMLTQAAAMGFDYTMEDAPLQMLRELTGRSDLEMDIKPTLTQPYWNFGFWPLKPITNNWFTLGSLNLNQLQALKDNDIDTIISLQPGPQQTPHDDVSKESKGKGEAKVQPAKPDIANMECVDLEGNGIPQEVSEEMEREAAQKAGLQYIYAPLDSEVLTLNTWKRIRHLVLAAGRSSSGLVLHGKWPRTTVVVGLLAAGCQQGRDSSWAMDRLARHGYLPTNSRGGSTNANQGYLDTVRNSVVRLMSLSWDYLSPVVNKLGLDHILHFSADKDLDLECLLIDVLDNRDEMCKL